MDKWTLCLSGYSYDIHVSGFDCIHEDGCGRPENTTPLTPSTGRVADPIYRTGG